MDIGERDHDLRERARKVIPGGLWGHMNVNAFIPGYPQFFARGEGAELWDVDGRRFVDFMCSWGPNILGHHNPAVEDAAARQRSLGDAMNGPGAVLVELAELLVETLPFAEWALFQKNGGDATTACVTIARAGTGRRKILVARGAYHGAVPWCSPSLAGVTTEDRAHLIHYDYNDAESLKAAAEEAKGDLAGIICTAFLHDYGKDQALVDPEFARTAREICTREDAALIVDDVRAGFRLDLRGTWASVGVEADLSAYSKAVANAPPPARGRSTPPAPSGTGPSPWRRRWPRSPPCGTRRRSRTWPPWASGCGTGSASWPPRTGSPSARRGRRRCRWCCSTTIRTSLWATPSASGR